MKKQYIKPAIEIVEIELETLMLTASGEQANASTGSGTAGNDTPTCRTNTAEHGATFGSDVKLKFRIIV